MFSFHVCLSSCDKLPGFSGALPSLLERIKWVFFSLLMIRKLLFLSQVPHSLPCLWILLLLSGTCGLMCAEEVLTWAATPEVRCSFVTHFSLQFICHQIDAQNNVLDNKFWFMKVEQNCSLINGQSSTLIVKDIFCSASQVTFSSSLWVKLESPSLI